MHLKQKKTKLLMILSILFASICLLGIFYGLQWINSFLSITAPVNADVLIVEGWLHEYMIEEAIQEINKNHYIFILITDMPVKEPHLKKESRKTYSTSADDIAKLLIDKGVDSNKIVPINTQEKRIHKTYSMALDCREWLGRNVPGLKAINIYSGGPHGRKTYITFKKVFEPSVKVGIFSAKIKHYPARFWFLSPRGIEATGKNLIGYFYALFL